MKINVSDLELQICQIHERLQFGNCGFAFTQAFSAEAMALACNRFSEVRAWWDTRINSADRRNYGYLNSTWEVISARLDCLAAVRAVESVLI